MDKKIYEQPTVTKIEFDVNNLVAPSACKHAESYLADATDPNCKG